MGATKKIHYRRIMLKFSGEALLGKKSCGIDTAVITNVAQEIKPLLANKVQVGVIIGGGNFFRGAKLKQEMISRITGDYLGMFATMMNALAMRDVFEKLHIPTKIMSALPVPGIIEGHDRVKANHYLNQNFITIFAGGIGNPLVTTDTALSLRGIELNADLLVKATNVDGVYSADPRINPKAKLYTHLNYQQALTKKLAVMDLTAFCLCRDHKMKLRVFNMHKRGALLRIVKGADEGTLVE
jgi:uridylate kinase